MAENGREWQYGSIAVWKSIQYGRVWQSTQYGRVFSMAAAEYITEYSCLI